MAPPPFWEHRLSRTAVTLLGCGLVGMLAWTFAVSWHPAESDYTFQGIDVDERQGVIHWPTIEADGVDFAYLRATIGADQRDKQFATSWADAHGAGMRRGAIHVWSFCRSGADQANNFNTTVPHAPDALPAAVQIDFADDCVSRPERDVVVGEVKRFATMVEAHTRKPVLLKISERVEQAYRVSAGVNRPLWSIANFFSPNYSARPWRMWQTSDMRRIDGLNGPVRWSVVAP